METSRAWRSFSSACCFRCPASLPLRDRNCPVSVFSSCSDIKGWTRELLSGDQGVGSSYPPPARTETRLHCQVGTTHTLLNNNSIMHTAPSTRPFQLRDQLKVSPGWDPQSRLPGQQDASSLDSVDLTGVFHLSYPFPRRYQKETVLYWSP